MTTPAPPVAASWGSSSGRWILVTTVAASGMAFLDGTVVNVALPTIGRELDAELAGLQWVLNGYMLPLAALILLSGSLGDRYGRRRMFLVGVVWFAVASAVCAVSTGLVMLVLSRIAQGIGGALLTPGSLALIEAGFRREDRARAIGAWAGLTGVASAVGPFVGGWLVEAASWRLIFVLNLPLAVAVLLAARKVPESRDGRARGPLDLSGAGLAAVGLAGVTYALIEAGAHRPTSLAVGAGVAGALALVAFAVVEMRSAHPMLPPGVFRSRQFVAANAVTVAVYAALGAVFFLLVIQLQVGLGYSALQAGVASLPITALMLALSTRSGQLAARIGPRAQMSAGPVVLAAGLVLMVRIDPGESYAAAVLPAVLVVGLGLSVTVAPLTATALAAAGEEYAGLASGVNNAVARSAQLTAVAVIPLAAGLTGATYRHPGAFSRGFDHAMLLTAALAAVGGIVALVTIRNPGTPSRPADPDPYQCSLDGTPLRGCPRSAGRGDGT